MSRSFTNPDRIFRLRGTKPQMPDYLGATLLDRVNSIYHALRVSVVRDITLYDLERYAQATGQQISIDGNTVVLTAKRRKFVMRRRLDDRGIRWIVDWEWEVELTAEMIIFRPVLVGEGSNPDKEKMSVIDLGFEARQYPVSTYVSPNQAIIDVSELGLPIHYVYVEDMLDLLANEMNELIQSAYLDSSEGDISRFMTRLYQAVIELKKSLR